MQINSRSDRCMKNVCPCIDNGDKNRKGRRLSEGRGRKMKKMLKTWFTAHTERTRCPYTHFLINNKKIFKERKRKTCEAKCHLISNACALNGRHKKEDFIFLWWNDDDEQEDESICETRGEVSRKRACMNVFDVCIEPWWVFALRYLST